MSAQWSERISTAWQKSVAGIFECGRLLIDAKEALPHGEFGAMCEGSLPFSVNTAQILMKVAADKRLANPEHVQLLPSSWGTLYELTKLDDKQWKHVVDKGLLRPDIERKEIVAMRRAPAKRRTRADNATAPKDLEAKRIVASLKKMKASDLTDPAWFAGQLHVHASRLNPLKWKLAK